MAIEAELDVSAANAGVIEDNIARFRVTTKDKLGTRLPRRIG
jgi:hypothetical protein